MPITDYCWAFSTITKATLQGSSTYQIVNFTVQNDQTSPILGWKEPQRKGTISPRRARYAPDALGAQKADGPWEAVWCMMPMTPLQFAYIDTNQFSNGTLESAPCTIQTWDFAFNAFNCFTFTVARPIFGQDYDILDGFYVDVKYRFTEGTKL